MFERNNIELLTDIIESISKIKKYVAGLTFEEFLNDEKTIDAVVRNFEIIGEAANRLEKEFTKKYPYLNWKRIIGLRHRIIHEYFGIDYQVIWNIINNNLETFKIQIEEIIQIFPQ